MKRNLMLPLSPMPADPAGTDTKTWVLRLDAAFLGLAGASGLVNDLNGAFTGRGPVGLVLRDVPEAALGFCEAHGLAVILAVLILTARSERRLHVAVAATHLLLGAANVTFWELFVTGNVLAVGYVTTALHALFFGLQSVLALVPRAGHGGTRAGSA
jgi:hypothetical protein